MKFEAQASCCTPTNNDARALQAYVNGVIQYEADTRKQFASLYRQDVVTYPIPFFGDVCTAKVLTIGVNPSAEEFVGRQWPLELNPTALTRRLLSYFEGDNVPHHRWFRPWEESLAMLNLNLSYGCGAAHLDLSPRATKSMAAADPGMFREMVNQDVDWFFKLLPLCKAARCILIAGTVTKSTYAHRFLHEVAQKYDFALTGNFRTKGPAHTSLLHLTGPEVSLPVFFCSVSPSARNKHLLPNRVERSATMIRSWITGDSALNA